MPHPHPVLSSARAWAPALPLCPVLTDHRAALWVRPPPATKPDPLRAPAPKRHRPPTAGPPAAPPGTAQTSRPADQGEGDWLGEVMRGCFTGPLGAERREAQEGLGPGGPERGYGSQGPRAMWPLKSQQDEWPHSPAHHGPPHSLRPQHGFSVGISLPQRPAKPSEKPRLRQIPSAEDLETDGGGVGPVGDDGLEHRESSHGQHEARGPVPLQQHQQVWQHPCAWKGIVGRPWGLA